MLPHFKCVSFAPCSTEVLADMFKNGPSNAQEKKMFKTHGIVFTLEDLGRLGFFPKNCCSGSFEIFSKDYVIIPSSELTDSLQLVEKLMRENHELKTQNKQI